MFKSLITTAILLTSAYSFADYRSPMIQQTRAEAAAQVEKTKDRWVVQFNSNAYGTVYNELGEVQYVMHLRDFNCKTQPQSDEGRIDEYPTIIGYGVTHLTAIEVRDAIFYLDAKDKSVIDSPYCVQK